MQIRKDYRQNIACFLVVFEWKEIVLLEHEREGDTFLTFQN